MSRIRVLSAGRNPQCDIPLSGTSVSRRHAEIVPLSNGNYYVTDCNSTGGTYIHNGSTWRRIRQGVARISDRIRFGKYEISVARIAQAALKDAPGHQRAGGRQPTREGIDPGKGLVRDPMTGEVIEKTSE